MIFGINDPEPELPKGNIDPASVPDGSMHVLLLREMWSETFTLVLDNGHTEELGPEELREWFKVRGANMDKMDKVFDQAWNFQRAEVIIGMPKTPVNTRPSYAPNIGQ